MMADYEEQVLITGVKSGRHCTICKVPPNERENLTRRWSTRTHADMQKQIATQRLDNINRTNSEWVHDLYNFAWDHHLLNIHMAMGVDILHQLHKGIMMHLISWIKLVLGNSTVSTTKRKRGNLTSITQTRPLEQLDYRFRQIPSFSGLKIFKNFSGVKQWTGVEQKAIARQLIAVLTPLLLAKEPMALLFARASMDFIIMAQYHTHDEETLRYLHHALDRMDKLKDIFRVFRATDSSTGEGHFNFPKFHVMTHYIDFIRRFGAADNTDTSHSEAAHKYLIKVFYGRTNKQDDFMVQILHHNLRRNKLQAMEDNLKHQEIRRDSYSNQDEQLYITQPTRKINLTELGWLCITEDLLQLHRLKLSRQYWRRASQVAKEINSPHFINSLANFVTICRNTLRNIALSDNQLDRLQENSEWAGELFISIHSSIRCWKPPGTDPLDPDKMCSELVRCPIGGSRGLRKDYVYVQEYTEDQHAVPGSLNGKLIGQLQLVFTVVDTLHRDEDDHYLNFSGAFVELLRLKNRGKYHDIHGMIELEKWPSTTNEQRRQRTLGAYRIYKMTNIHRSAHVVPASLDENGTFLLNNYIDWHQFNELYDDNWMEKGTRTADRIHRQFKQRSV